MSGTVPLMRVEVLGPLRLVIDGRAVSVPGQKRRAVLALLAVSEGRTLTVDQLVDSVWPMAAPESGRAALHSHISRIRGHLGAVAARLQTRAEGYRLELGVDDLDAAQARALLSTARARMSTDPGAAFAALAQAHALWRGPELADLTDVAAIATTVTRYAQLRRDITDALVASGVAAGSADRVVTLAADSVQEDPLREPAVLLFMRVLAATGRAPEALRIGREYRERLAEEAGLDPSPSLDELVREIASGDTGHQPPHTAPSVPFGASDVTAPTDADAMLPVAMPGSAPAGLYGRDIEFSELPGLLRAHRLVTLVGPGGVGKTRLAAAVARQGESATIVRLGPVTDPVGIPHALAAALRLTVGQGDVLAACLAVLADRPGLLFIDNCEHLLEPVRQTVGAILDACPSLSVLATSREPLGLAEEFIRRLDPLAVPQPDQDPLQAPAVAVFLNRARRVRSGPEATPAELALVSDIVARLDGMPLAIELAAGRLSTFSIAALHERLDRALDLLGGQPSSDARHGTLRETIDWSYRLLSPAEQRLFRHASAFPDGLNLDTAEELARRLCPEADPGRLLSKLVDASMIVADFGGERGASPQGPDEPGGAVRFRMLETLRAFAHDRLTAAGEHEAAAGYLLQWAADLTSWIGATLATEREPDADGVLRRELGNLRAAWFLARSHAALDIRVDMISALYEAVSYRDLVELRDWADELAAESALPGHPRAAMVLATAAEAAYHRGDYAKAERLAQSGLAQSRDGDGAWYCHIVLAVVALARGAHDEVVAHCRTAATLRSEPRDSPGLIALAAAYAGRPEEAGEHNAQGLAAAVSPTMRAWGAYVTGEIENSLGHDAAAEPHYLTAIELARASGASFFVGIATVGLLSVRARAGRVADALAGYRDVIDYFDRTGNWTHQWTTLRNLADLLRRIDDHETATVLDAAADQAPDAPAVTGRVTTSVVAVPGRAVVLELARQAIDRNLTGAGQTPRR